MIVTSRRGAIGALLVFCAIVLPSHARAQLRVATWNISFYGGGRTVDIQNTVYATFEGRSLNPDVILLQEITTASGLLAMRDALNSAPGSPGDWQAAPFVDGPDTESAFVYRTGRVVLVGNYTVSFGGALTTQPPRNTYRYDFRPVGYTSAAASIGAYCTHMKAGSTSTDQARRLVEAQRIRDNAQGVDTAGAGTALPAGFQFLLGGDLNIQTSSQAAYQKLVGSEPDDTGRFFDPISTPGNWNNNGAFRFVHTQDPIGSGGMDDRHDQLLVSAGLIDGAGLDYIGQPAIPYSTTTWNDPNHSYRAWGNDGSSFNVNLTVAGNTMVGPTIAQAIINCANGAGHIPVFLDLRVPARVGAPAMIDFGTVAQFSTAEQLLTVSNVADVGLWTASGIASLNYAMSVSAGFTAPAGTFVAPPGGNNTQLIHMDTSTPGPKSGTLTILSDDPEEPSRLVNLVGLVVVPCLAADANCDLSVTVADAAPFVELLLGTGSACGPCTGDLNDDGLVNGDDVQPFVAALFTP